MSHVLTLNAGSSSLKFGLFTKDTAPKALATGLIGAIGGAATFQLEDAQGSVLTRGDMSPKDGTTHASSLSAALKELMARFPDADVRAVGHRVVHGGQHHAEPVILDNETVDGLAALTPFAPLHQPHNLAGIHAAQVAFPDAVQVACFDTAFHRNHPFVNDTFAIPRRFYDKGVRRYGFHGLSYDYISGEMERIAPHLLAGRVVVAHLGNGASMCGMLNGRSMASTMGFSALDGLPMGTRSGQLDPGVMLYLLDQEGLSTAEVSDLLYKQSGLLGLSELSNDMRALLASDDPKAREAVEYFVFRIRRELGGLAAALQGLDALVFTGGIGENAREIRARVCAGMAWLGIELDEARNMANETLISSDFSRTRVMVVPTNEELVIARAAVDLV